MPRIVCLLIVLSLPAAAKAQSTPQPENIPTAASAGPEAPASTAEDLQVDPPEQTGDTSLLRDPETARYFRVNSDAYSTVSVARGLSMHKPMYVYPLSYSPDFEGDETEFIFQLSAKYRLFGKPLYFAYTQKSFWQLYNQDESRPFRETNYNPEIFYRFVPEDAEKWHHWGADIGLEHESNGEALPLSRSWNRIYFAAFKAEGKNLLYLKTWYRIPDPKKETPDDPKGDDNPDIYKYYGYGEIHYARQIGKQQLLSSMIRGNPSTGKGGMSLSWSMPNDSGTLFYSVSLWHGYGESLIDYNHSVTRLSFGIMLSR